jgi:hypothetical protein
MADGAGPASEIERLNPGMKVTLTPIEPAGAAA